MKIDKKRTSCF